MTQVKTPRIPEAWPRSSTSFALEIKTALVPVLVDAYEVTAAQARRKEQLLRLASPSPWRERWPR